MTHYGENFGYVPFREDIRANLERLDRGALEPLLASDVDGFRGYIERTRATVCGRRAIEILLRLLPADCPGELAAYDTSGRMTGSWDHSVSYASVVYRQPRDAESGAGLRRGAMSLDASEQRTLLAVARASIRDSLCRDGSLDAVLAQAEITTALRERRGLFVTLKARASAGASPVERLRGCVGTLAPDRTLVPELVVIAPRAALRDPRFPPLRAEELDGVLLSLSILNPAGAAR